MMLLHKASNQVWNTNEGVFDEFCDNIWFSDSNKLLLSSFSDQEIKQLSKYDLGSL